MTTGDQTIGGVKSFSDAIKASTGTSLRLQDSTGSGVFSILPGGAEFTNTVTDSGQVVINSTGLATLGHYLRFIAIGQKTGGASRRAEVGIKYLNQSGSGGSNEAHGYLLLTAGDGATTFYGLIIQTS